ncbi:hypothetical protein CF165_49180 [Amycolatopsis vastitatis]|uniref:Uncharacterized protein n=1 Tax=Amycolatopsis vastitatis TaxID=1905142 RepID=A0A229SJV0_9PSEU|nr:hypothetical protein CF165_49180 [Amycolatopsis vastitatis]
MKRSPGSIFQHQDAPRIYTPYRGSQRLADLALAAPYCQDLYRPLVRDRVRVAYVLGCMLLAELHLHGWIRLSHGRIYPADTASTDDSALTEILEHLRAVPYAEPAVKWLDFLALGELSTTLVWRRLVQDGAAQVEGKRRRARYVLADVRASLWARRFLEAHGTVDEVSDAAVVLWRGLRELRLDARALELDRVSAGRRGVPGRAGTAVRRSCLCPRPRGHPAVAAAHVPFRPTWFPTRRLEEFDPCLICAAALPKPREVSMPRSRPVGCRPVRSLAMRSPPRPRPPWSPGSWWSGSRTPARTSRSCSPGSQLSTGCSVSATWRRPGWSRSTPPAARSTIWPAVGWGGRWVSAPAGWPWPPTPRSPSGSSG